MPHSSEELLNSDLLETIRISIQKEKGTQRQIHVQMVIPYPVEQVWQVITDYDRLTGVIPNLVRCRQVGQTETSKHLEFVASCQILKVGFSVRLVLNVIEAAPYHIDTQLVEGDLRSYRGQWHLKQNHDGSTRLAYLAEMTPKAGIPVTLLERQARHLLPINFLAISSYLDQMNQTNPLVASHD